jgi:hypothetical protein
VLEVHRRDYSRAIRRILAGLCVALALAAAGCGGGGGGQTQAAPKERSPESVVRAWSLAINSNDNRAAGRLFAKNARVIQGSLDIRLPNLRVATLFNASLPCSGRLAHLTRDGDVVTATFVLGPRPTGPLCTGPGQKASAAFTIRHGKIVQWQQVPNPSEGPSA